MARLLLSAIFGLLLTSSCMHRRGHDDHSHSGKGEVKTMGMGMGSMMVDPGSHEKMAKLHSDAAQCLRAGKSQESCLDTFKKSHQDLCQQMGGQGCRAMDEKRKKIE